MKVKAGKKLKITAGNTPINRILNILGTFILITGVTYGFLCLVNWSFDLTEWTRFSRFILGFEGIIFLIKIIDEL